MGESLQATLFVAPKTLRDEKAFRAWLRTEARLGPRSVGDVVSRVKRAMGYADLLAPVSDYELVFRLQESGAYRECSTSVRSQLKRAAQLYREFRSVMARKP